MKRNRIPIERLTTLLQFQDDTRCVQCCWGVERPVSLVSRDRASRRGVKPLGEGDLRHFLSLSSCVTTGHLLLDMPAPHEELFVLRNSSDAFSQILFAGCRNKILHLLKASTLRPFTLRYSHEVERTSFMWIWYEGSWVAVLVFICRLTSAVSSAAPFSEKCDLGCRKVSAKGRPLVFDKPSLLSVIERYEGCVINNWLITKTPYQ